MSLHYEKCSAFGYEIRGALPVRANFRRAHGNEFVDSLPDPSTAYFSTDSVTQTCLIRVRCPYTDSPEVEDTLVRFAQKWAAAGAIFYRQCMGEVSFFPLGLPAHVKLLAELDSERIRQASEDEHTQYVRCRIQDELRECTDDEPPLPSTQTGANHA
ncbi:hypothetical protein C7413_102173 [Paraburkholderia silvatlantica]|nr:hypothetical protein C7411_102248 [Paraburkholderia silvatlantica]PXW41767.1 hypothetical protein C7413_102173 [Paraburkholderia silvatlantica]PYE26234.1 hypothetical protein C7410_103150 [Paraburkholderia silvatlantica]